MWLRNATLKNQILRINIENNMGKPVIGICSSEDVLLKEQPIWETKFSEPILETIWENQSLEYTFLSMDCTYELTVWKTKSTE